MKTLSKKIWLIILSCLFIVCSLFGVACGDTEDSSSGSSNSSEESADALVSYESGEYLLNDFEDVRQMYDVQFTSADNLILKGQINTDSRYVKRGNGSFQVSLQRGANWELLFSFKKTQIPNIDVEKIQAIKISMYNANDVNVVAKVHLRTEKSPLKSMAFDLAPQAWTEISMPFGALASFVRSYTLEVCAHAGQTIYIDNVRASFDEQNVTLNGFPLLSVDSLIGEIDTISFANEILTPAEVTKVVALRECYENFSQEEKKAVTNYQKLVEAEEKVATSTMVAYDMSDVATIGYFANDSMLYPWDGNCTQGEVEGVGNVLNVNVTGKIEWHVSITYSIPATLYHSLQQYNRIKFSIYNPTSNSSLTFFANKTAESPKSAPVNTVLAGKAWTEIEMTVNDFMNVAKILCAISNDTGVTWQYSNFYAYNVDEQKDIKDTIAMIDTLPDLSEAVTITLEQKEQIEAARAAYEALGEQARKDEVTNYAKLVQAEARMEELKPYMIKTLIESLPSIETNGVVTVTVEYARTLAEYRALYEGLTDEEKQIVTNLADLEAAERQAANPDRLELFDVEDYQHSNAKYTWNGEEGIENSDQYGKLKTVALQGNNWFQLGFTLPDDIESKLAEFDYVEMYLYTKLGAADVYVSSLEYFMASSGLKGANVKTNCDWVTVRFTVEEFLDAFEKDGMIATWTQKDYVWKFSSFYAVKAPKGTTNILGIQTVQANVIPNTYTMSVTGNTNSGYTAALTRTDDKTDWQNTKQLWTLASRSIANEESATFTITTDSTWINLFLGGRSVGGVNANTTVKVSIEVNDGIATIEANGRTITIEDFTNLNQLTIGADFNTNSYKSFSWKFSAITMVVMNEVFEGTLETASVSANTVPSTSTLSVSEYGSTATFTRTDDKTDWQKTQAILKLADYAIADGQTASFTITTDSNWIGLQLGGKSGGGVNAKSTVTVTIQVNNGTATITANGKTITIENFTNLSQLTIGANFNTDAYKSFTWVFSPLVIDGVAVNNTPVQKNSVPAVYTCAITDLGTTVQMTRTDWNDATKILKLADFELKDGQTATFTVKNTSSNAFSIKVNGLNNSYINIDEVLTVTISKANGETTISYGKVTGTATIDNLNQISLGVEHATLTSFSLFISSITIMVQ